MIGDYIDTGDGKMRCFGVIFLYFLAAGNLRSSLAGKQQTQYATLLRIMIPIATK